MLLSAAPEEEEIPEETLLEEDRVHLDLQAVEELRQTLQHLLHKYQSQQRLMFAPWAQPHVPSQENVTKQKTGLINYKDIIVLTLESRCHRQDSNPLDSSDFTASRRLYEVSGEVERTQLIWQNCLATCKAVSPVQDTT